MRCTHLGERLAVASGAGPRDGAVSHVFLGEAFSNDKVVCENFIWRAGCRVWGRLGDFWA